QKLAHIRHQDIQIEDGGFQRLPATEGQHLTRERGGAVGCTTDLLAASQQRVRGLKPFDHQIAVTLINVNRLLKSCATPPARRPKASIFCDWRSSSSSLRFCNSFFCRVLRIRPNARVTRPTSSSPPASRGKAKSPCSRACTPLSRFAKGRVKASEMKKASHMATTRASPPSASSSRLISLRNSAAAA